MILYGYPMSSASYRVRIALALKGIEVTTVTKQLRRGEQRAKDFLRSIHRVSCRYWAWTTARCLRSRSPSSNISRRYTRGRPCCRAAPIERAPRRALEPAHRLRHPSAQ